MREFIIPEDYVEGGYLELEFDYIERECKELIRCEDCIHHHGYNCDRLYGFQDAFTLKDDDYCSRAERRGEE